MARSCASLTSGYENLPEYHPASQRPKNNQRRSHTFALFGPAPFVDIVFRLHLLKYDRSGRSSGVAFITYETAAEAAQAKREFDGKFAKGASASLFLFLFLYAVVSALGFGFWWWNRS